MSLIRRRRVSLALENVTQVSTTVRAHNLRPLHAKGAVRVPGHGARHGVKESRPAASRLELVLCSVQGCLAAGAGVDALGGSVLVVLTGEWSFGAFFSEDAELFCHRNVSEWS